MPNVKVDVTQAWFGSGIWTFGLISDFGLTAAGLVPDRPAGYADGVILSAASVRLAAATPNLLSALRLALAAAFPVLPDTWRAPAILTAALTDLLDGYIARRFHFTSWQGGLLDAAADKLFVLSALVTLTRAGELSLPGVVLLLSRDLTVTVMFIYIVATRRWDAIRNMPSRPFGKLATAGIYLFMFTAALRPHLPRVDHIVTGLFLTAAAVALLAAIDYIVIFVRALRADRRKGDSAPAP